VFVKGGIMPGVEGRKADFSTALRFGRNDVFWDGIGFVVGFIFGRWMVGEGVLAGGRACVPPSQKREGWGTRQILRLRRRMTTKKTQATATTEGSVFSCSAFQFKATADSFAALRNDKQKNRQPQEQRQKQMPGFSYSTGSLAL
jgi:hypothetical protein